MDNTKGIVIIKNEYFQKSTLTYAEFKEIALVRIMPDNQITFVEFAMPKRISHKLIDEEKQERKKKKISH